MTDVVAPSPYPQRPRWLRPSKAVHDEEVARLLNAANETTREMVARRRALGTVYAHGTRSVRFATCTVTPTMEPGTVLLSDVAVRPKRQREGIGRQMMERLRVKLAEDGVNVVVAYTYPGQRGAEALARSMGAEPSPAGEGTLWRLTL